MIVNSGWAPKSAIRSYPIIHYIPSKICSPCYKNFLAAITVDTEASWFSKALSMPQWSEAIRCEINALKRNQTWRINNLPSGKKAIGCKWIYEIERKSDRSRERYKGYLVTF